MLQFDLAEFRDAMYARIVKKVGERKYWEKWASDIADIAQAHITRIQRPARRRRPRPRRRSSRRSSTGCAATSTRPSPPTRRSRCSPSTSSPGPIFEALFAGYDFAAHNPVAQTMELMLASLDEHSLEAEQQSLDRFYASVRRRVEGVATPRASSGSSSSSTTTSSPPRSRRPSTGSASSTPRSRSSTSSSTPPTRCCARSSAKGSPTRACTSSTASPAPAPSSSGCCSPG